MGEKTSAMTTSMRQVNESSNHDSFGTEKRRRWSQIDYLYGDKKKDCLIDPFSPLMQAWDIILFLGIIYVSVVTPFDASFLEPNFGNGLFFANLVVDLIFLVDIFITFNLPIVDRMTGLQVRDRKEIARRYFKGWFFIDFISIFPFDYLVLALNPNLAQNGNALRSLRLLKLLKIFRIVRGNRIYKRWRFYIGPNLTVLYMILHASALLLVAHWVACILGALPYLEDSPDVNWQVEYFAGLGVADPGTWAIYLASFYWSVMTLTTIGFGDISAVTDFERGMMIFFMFFGASFQAYLIGAICGLVAELSESSTQNRLQMNSLNEFMSSYNMSFDLRVRLRKYFAYAQSVQDTEKYKHLLVNMSPGLQEEVSFVINQVWVEQVPFIENCADPSERDGLVLKLSQKLNVKLYSPFERIQSVGDDVNKLFIIAKGLVVLHISSDPFKHTDDEVELGSMNVRLSVTESIREELIRGQCFGHELIYAGQQSLYNVTSLQFCELHVLTKENLDQVLEKFPLTRSAIDRYSKSKAYI